MKDLIIQISNQIPAGKVASYGDVADQINNIYMLTWNSEKTSWRIVGKILSAMPEHDRKQLPRHRIINTKWYVSSLKLGNKWITQIQLLRQEWIEVSDDWFLDMAKYRFADRNL